MGKRTRDRQLAKAAAKRRAQQQARRRRRNLIVTGVVVAALVVGAAVAFAVTRSGGGTAAKGATPSTSAAASVTPSPGPKNVACGAKQPADALTPKPQFPSPPTVTINTAKTFIATLDTSCGRIVIRLDASQAPETVNSFVFLAQHHFYDGTWFHRIADSIDIIQGGDPTGTGQGGPGYSTKDELTGKEKYSTGTVAMANAGPNTQGSQFFIVTGPKGEQLDKSPNYTIFGSVVKGLDVAQKIQGLPVGGSSGDSPKQAAYIDTLRVEQK
jgi:cyclophilin family peptidyl-prolyl cis-trans isomerase